MATPKEGATKTQGGKKYVYKNGKWRSSQYRTPANDLIERTGTTARSATTRSASATSTAASRTAERERQAQQNGIGLSGRRERDRTNNPREGDTKTAEGNKFVFRGGKWVKASNAKPAAKPEAKPNWRNRTGTADVEQLRQGQNDAIRNHPGNKPQPAASPKPAAVTSGGGRGSSATPPASRPASTASKIGSSSGGGTSKIHTYKEHGSDLHVGRHKTLAEHRAAVEKAKGGGSSSSSSSSDKAPNGKEYAGPGGGPNSNPARNYSTPDEKSKHVDHNGNPQVGYNPQNKPDGTKYKAGKAATNRTGDNNPDVASKATNKYLEEIKKKREGRSTVVG